MSSYIPSTASHFTKGGEGREATTEKIKRKNSRLSYIISPAVIDQKYSELFIFMIKA